MWNVQEWGKTHSCNFKIFMYVFSRILIMKKVLSIVIFILLCSYSFAQNNSSIVNQTGDNNNSSVSQTGSSNISTVEQKQNGNNANVTQTGSGNTAEQNQSGWQILWFSGGGDHDAEIIQNGSGNYAQQNQNKTGNNAYINQDGNGNTAEQKQDALLGDSGYNEAFIKQVGSSNDGFQNQF